MPESKSPLPGAPPRPPLPRPRAASKSPRPPPPALPPLPAFSASISPARGGPGNGGPPPVSGAAGGGSTSFCLALISFSMSACVLSFRERSNRWPPRAEIVFKFRSFNSRSRFWSISIVELTRVSMISVFFNRFFTNFAKTSKASPTSSAKEHSTIDRGSGFSSSVLLPDSCIPDLPQKSRVESLQSPRTSVKFPSSFFLTSSVSFDSSSPMLMMSSNHFIIPYSILSIISSICSQLPFALDTCNNLPL
mmetsp:Transcript_59431/g.145448  ORF Transcript_59431/g.145448 Transcript_59431/m.145448 type:complete len:249 (-) Transcript_59431:4815-5561(-)